MHTACKTLGLRLVMIISWTIIFSNTSKTLMRSETEGFVNLPANTYSRLIRFLYDTFLDHGVRNSGKLIKLSVFRSNPHHHISIAPRVQHVVLS